MLSKRVLVAVGVIFNSKGQVLIAQRLSHQHQAECWEFPGGKVEPGETIPQALKRELMEEVGLTVLAHEPWFTIEHDYPDKSITLYVHTVTKFAGEAQGLEGQPIRWVAPQSLGDYPFPNANRRIMEALIVLEPSVLS